jgi:hypothetical protein
VAVELEVRVSDVTETAKALRREGKRLERRITSAAGRVVTKIYLPKLKALTPNFMPGGYAPTLAKDLKVRTQVQFAGNPGVSAFVSAPTGGSKGGRAVTALERGDLRHPLFGNKSHWYRNKRGVKPGLAKAALKSTKNQIVAGMDTEVQKIMADIVRG